VPAVFTDADMHHFSALHWSIQSTPFSACGSSSLLCWCQFFTCCVDWQLLAMWMDRCI